MKLSLDTVENHIRLNDVEKIISQQITLLKEQYRNEDGIISATYPPSQELPLSDLNDIYPFLLENGEEEFVLEQLLLILKKQDLLYKGLPVVNKTCIYSWRLDEWMGALLLVYQASGNKTVRDTLEEALGSIFEELSQYGYFSSIYNVSKKWASPALSSQSFALLEVFAEYVEVIEQLGFKEQCISLIDSSVEVATHSNYFKNFGTFPYLFKQFNIVPIVPREAVSLLHETADTKGLAFELHKMKLMWSSFTFTHIMKANTNLIFAFLEIEKQQILNRRHNIQQSVETWLENLPIENGAVQTFLKGKDRTQDTVISINQNFPIIDIVCDYSRYVRKNSTFVKMAKDIASYFLQERMQKIPKTNHSLSLVNVDAIMDFSLSLLRLSELSNESDYAYEAIEIMSQILRKPDLKTANGFYNYIDLDNGQAHTIAPKYNALLLKHLFVLREIFKKNGNITEIVTNNHILQIIKDR